MAMNSSVYSDCLNLRSRLLSLPGFGLFSEFLLDDSLYPDPVSCIQELFCLGIPLCYLFNLLPSSAYPRIDLDFTRTQSEGYSSRIAIALFALRTSQAFGCEYFTVTELLERESTAGLRKAVDAVSLVLHALPDAKPRSQIPRYPKNNNSTRVERLNTFESEWKDHISKLIKSERQYIRDMETLEALSQSLVAAGAMDSETSSLVFPKKLFTFARKFRLQLECVSELPWDEQRWGQQFVMHASDFEVIYQIYCVNRVLAEPNFAAVTSLKVFGQYMTAEYMKSLLNVPPQHVSEYMDTLNILIRILTLHEKKHKNLEDLHSGRTALRGVIDNLLRAQQRAKTDQTRESLKKRINDWDGLDMNNMGLLLLNDNMSVRRNGIIQTFDVFLFENVLLLCDEVLPPPTSAKIGRRKASSVSTTSPPLPSLYIKDYWNTKMILLIEMDMLERAEDTGLRIYYELSLDLGNYKISLLCQTEVLMHKWQSEIESIRRAQTQHPRSRRAYTVNNVLSRIDFGPTSQDLDSVAIEMFKMASIDKKDRVFVQLRHGSSTFVLSIPLPIEYDILAKRIEEKLRSCRRWSIDRPPTITRITDEGHVEAITPKTDLAAISNEGGKLVPLSVR